MKRKFRLRQQKDIQRVRNEGQSFVHPLLVLLAIPNSDASNDSPIPTRIGVITGKRLGKAVVRNQIRRRVRAAAYQLYAQVDANWDLLFLGRQPIADASYQQIAEAVQILIKRAGLMSES
ncbi:MAG: ribonuclease P protein component [Anaerolineaceae bacterium]|nr:ribonuclease P protein component [Anaerolineaceae bacterium]